MVSNETLKEMINPTLGTKDLIQMRLNLRDTIARRWAQNIWGSGYVFQHADKQINEVFNEFAIKNKLLTQMTYIERMLSSYGRVLVTLNETETGDIMLNVAPPYYLANVARTFCTPTLAVVYQTFNHDQNAYVIKSTYTLQRVTHEIFTNNEETNEIELLGDSGKILKELKIKSSYPNKLGFIPVVEFTNIAFTPISWDIWVFVQLADWYNAYRFEENIYDILYNFKKELYLNHTRIAGTSGSQSFYQKFNEALSQGNNFADFFISTDNGDSVKIMNGTGDFTHYTKSLNDLIDVYFKFCGLSKFSEGGGAQKTQSETASIRSNLVETTQSKIVLREKQWGELIYKVLKWKLGKDVFDFEFSIPGNILKDETQEIDNKIKLIQEGAMSTIDLIQYVFKISKQEAQEKFKEIQEFNKENQDDFTILGGGDEMDEQQAQEGNFNHTTGEHKNAKFRGEA